MPLNLQGFITEPNQWAGLYHAADQLEKRKLRQDQLAAQQQAKRNASGAFLQNYLDPKDYLSGTQFDPLILQGLDEAKRQGAQLVSSGVDNAGLMMALGPLVNKVSTYSTNAKNINKQVDDQIKLMKDSGEIGYDYNSLKQEALRNAFYKQNAQGQMQLDPDQADPSIDWISKAIELSPEKVTNTAGFDTFADKAKLKSETFSTAEYDKFGTLNKHNVNAKFQEYMVPEYKNGKLMGFVPKFDQMFEGQNPLMHTFSDESGKKARAQVRVLDSAIYEGLPKGLRDNVRGQVKQHLNEYETATGEKIAPNSAKAKWVERALAYNELNRPQRNYGTKGELIIENKPSPQMVNLNIQSTPQYQENLRNITEIKADVRDQHKPLKTNPIETLGEIFNGNEDYLQGVKHGVYGIDVTEVFPGGGLKSGRGQNFNYKKIYYDPASRSLTVEKENKQDMFGRKLITTEKIPESEIGKFARRIGEANGIGYPKIKELLKQMGYNNNEFSGAKEARLKQDVEQRKQNVEGWRKTFNQPLGLPFENAKQ